MAISCNLSQIGTIFILVALLKNYSSATGEIPDSPDCKIELCAFLDITCPEDSKPIEILPIPLSESKTHINASNQYIDKYLNHSMKLKRSVRPYKRRESIKIVPVGYIHKRSIPMDEFNQTSDEFLMECCIQNQCTCDTKCVQPNCATDQVLVLESDGNHLPGSCCPTYKCYPIQHDDQHHQQQSTCYSYAKKGHFLHGEIWMEDDCTRCECENGQSNCRSSVCKPINCEKKIYNRGECCPVCDLNNSKYCTGQEDCDIVCRNGYDIDITGCTICKCAKHLTTISTANNNDNTDVQTQPTDVSINNIKLSPTFEDLIYNYLIHIALLAIIIVIITLILWKYLQNKKNNRTYNIVPSV